MDKIKINRILKQFIFSDVSLKTELTPNIPNFQMILGDVYCLHYKIKSVPAA